MVTLSWRVYMLHPETSDLLAVRGDDQLLYLLGTGWSVDDVPGIIQHRDICERAVNAS